MSAEFLPGNRITLLETGSAYFPALRAAIDAAAREIHLETYIFEDDAIGRMIAAALCRAAKRGVAVRVLVDGFGAPEFPGKLMPSLEADGVQVLIYRREIARFRFRRHRLRRLHRKLVVVDARIAFVGGINIIDDINTPRHTPPRYDYAVRVEGPLLAHIHASARELWELVTWANFKRRLRAHMHPPVVTERLGSVLAAFLVRDNLRHRRDIEDAYMDAINAAKEEIVLANAYFLPGIRFRHALMNASQRGVRVIILLQGRVEYLLLHYASQALYGALLGAGVRLFEYHRSFLHAKVAAIDGKWATVGSSNIDPFSLMLAREANIVVRDRGFAGELRASLEAAMAHGAQELRREDWKRKPWYARLASWLAYSMVRLMIGIAGYGGRH
ncbi:MAG: cardiolipin synthase ClsB [Rhodocyclaceae bacterium]|jgi:cardiolipin synthase|nr:cardiolipin synthase ClsB [Rhodocyclaceae bacterium]